MARDYVYTNFAAPTITKEQLEKILKEPILNSTVDMTSRHHLYGDWDSQPTGEEEWIWVTGYKGTDKDMKCRDYQYELGKQHDMPEGADITMCYSGFHFCDKLNKTFNYYRIENGNRFFEVKALVRRWKKDGFYVTEQRDDKMVAKSIILTREFSIDEIFNAHGCSDQFTNWTTEQKELARQTSITKVQTSIKINNLVKCGYSEAFAAFVVENCVYDTAVMMADMPYVSMDVKVLAICMKIYR